MFSFENCNEKLVSPHNDRVQTVMTAMADGKALQALLFFLDPTYITYADRTSIVRAFNSDMDSDVTHQSPQFGC